MLNYVVALDYYSSRTNLGDYLMEPVHGGSPGACSSNCNVDLVGHSVDSIVAQ